MIEYVFIFLVSCLVTAILVPLLMKVANEIGFLDRPTKRKQHKISVPLVGGICMFAGFAASFFVFVGTDDMRFVYILLGGLAVLAIGVVDDYFKATGRDFPAWPRAVVQVAAASLVFFVGMRFTGFAVPFGLELPFFGAYIHFHPVVQYLLTVLWVFGVITVVNWSDGLDGLAGSLCTVTSITLFIVAMVTGERTLAVLSLMLVGVTVGFLKYNLFPAKIFMGDSGATFLGYMIAVIAVYGPFKQATTLSIIIPVLALGVPIFDNIFVIFKRFKDKKPLHKADATQIHHRLIRSGLNPKQAWGFLVLLSVSLNLISIIILLLERTGNG